MSDSSHDLSGHRHERACTSARQPTAFAPSLYYDPAIFETELERIFYKTWIWVAHESELPNPGDFRTTTIGRQPVIVVRDKTGDDQRAAEPLPPSRRDRMRAAQRQCKRLYVPVSQLDLWTRRRIARTALWRWL